MGCFEIGLSHLKIVVGSLWIVVNRCGSLRDGCGTLWVVPSFSNYAV